LRLTPPGGFGGGRRKRTQPGHLAGGLPDSGGGSQKRAGRKAGTAPRADLTRSRCMAPIPRSKRTTRPRATAVPRTAGDLKQVQTGLATSGDGGIPLVHRLRRAALARSRRSPARCAHRHRHPRPRWARRRM